MFTLDDLKKYLEQRDAADTTFFINPSFLSAIVGLTDDDRLVYDYDKMIAAAIEENPEWTEEDAIEWIDFNYQILRGIIATRSKSVNRKEIDALGFRAEYCSYYKITNRHRILRCYDIEYSLTSKKILNIHYVK